MTEDRQMLEHPITVRAGEVLRVEYTTREDGSVMFLRAGAARPDEQPKEWVNYVDAES